MISLKSPMSALIKTSSLNVFLTTLSCPFYNGLMRMKEESEKADLKLNINKTKIMTFGPITSWQTNGETMETVRVFNFLGLQNHY